MKNYTITVNGKAYEVTVEEGFTNGSVPAAAPRSAAPEVPQRAAVPPAAPVTPAPEPAQSAAPAGALGSVVINAPMPGKILGVKASVGQAVKRGDVLVILEAMKMENEIVAPSEGTVASINVAMGASVESGEILATLN